MNAVLHFSTLIIENLGLRMKLSTLYCYSLSIWPNGIPQSCPWVGLTHGLCRVGSGQVGSRFLAFWWVRLGRGSETFTKHSETRYILLSDLYLTDNVMFVDCCLTDSHNVSVK